jgi:hypothetical protein
LVASSELLNQYYRLSPAKDDPEASHKAAKKEGEPHSVDAATERSGRLLQRRRVVTMAVALPAAAFACREVVQDVVFVKPGAHHAVALLAAAQFTENAYRFLYSLGVQRAPAASLMVV